MSDRDGPRTRLPALYRRRFEPEDQSRQRVWKVLIETYFERHLRGATSVLDLGCGWGYFINQIDAVDRHAIDLNPEVALHLDPRIQLHIQAANQQWPLDDNSVDVVFTSNLFEHLADASVIADTLKEAYRCLRPGGRLICMGPNIRAVGGRYWDFFDHIVPLTERSMGEAVELTGFEIETSIARFVPFTMAGKTAPPSFLIRAYMSFRPAWRLLGGQFLVVALARH